jgi:hypothetical protein
MAKKAIPKRKAPRKTQPKPQFYYHITEVENVPSILSEGLKGTTTPRNRGDSFKVPSTCVLVSGDGGLMDDVAIHQIWYGVDIDQYAVFEIDSAGITGRVVPDNIAEQTAGFQRVVEQAVILPQYLKHISTRTINFPGKAAMRLMNLDLASPRKWTDEEWAIAKRWLPPYVVAIRRDLEKKSR